MRARLLVVTLCAGCSTPAPPPPKPASPPSAPSTAVFDVGQLRDDIRFLASDALEGRRAGTRGYDQAADYVAKRLGDLGLAPAGDHGYFQPIRLREVVPDLSATSAELSDPALAAVIHLPDTAIANTDLAHTDLDLTGKMTFVGRGICDPESGRDDAAGVDLTGRFAVLVAGVAEELPAARAAVRSDAASKWACVAKHGAIGIVNLRTRKASVAPWSMAVNSYRSGAMGLLEADGAHARFAPAPSLSVDAPAAQALLAAVGRDLETEERRAATGKPARFDLPGTLRLRVHTRARDLSSANVIGRIDGADARLAREAVVISAHLDHLGVDATGGIRNGAIDNASGIAELLAIARAFKAAAPPRRTILILATTGEELGLLGAEGFTAHPSWPLAQIAADINIDQTGMLWPIADVVADGAERSTLAGPAQRAAARLGFTVSPDPVPEQGFFLRSDQAPFARAGVPAMIFRPGFRDASGGTEHNRGLFQRWRGTAYHGVLDKIDQRDPPIDFDSGISMARVVYFTALDVANGDQRPAWNPGDVFAPRAAKQ